MKYKVQIREFQVRSSSLITIPIELEKLKRLEMVDIGIADKKVILDSIFNQYIKLRRLILLAENSTMFSNDLLSNSNKLEELCIKFLEE